MADEIHDVSGSRFEQVNLSGTRVHGAFLVGTKVTGAWVHSLDLSGNIQSLVVNGVEVAGYVQAELERRHPELRYLGSKDVPGLQRAWAKVQEIAAVTLDAARRLPPAMLDESVDDEYSYLQTLRHLVFADDQELPRLPGRLTMPLEILAALMLVSFFVLLMAGIPVAMTLAVSGFVFGFLGFGTTLFSLLPHRISAW